MKQTGASYQDTAIEFNMNNTALIANWNIGRDRRPARKSEGMATYD